MLLSAKTHAKSKSRNILVISQIFTPQISPRAFRWEQLTEYMALQGDRIDVVTGWMPSLPREETQGRVRIHRVGGSLIERTRSRLIREYPAAFAGIQPPTNGKPTLNLRVVAGKSLSLLHSFTWKKIYWPDYACLWYYPGAYKTRELLSQREYTAMISVSDPFTSHAIAYRLKKIHPRLRWVVDIGDPFSFRREQPSNNHSLYAALNNHLEACVFYKADAIAITNQAIADKYSEIHPFAAGKLTVIPPLCAPPGSSQSETNFFPSDKKIRMLYVGTLDCRLRRPELLLRIFSELGTGELKNRLELHFVGPNATGKRLFQPYAPLMNKNLFLHGPKPREQALQIMKEGTVLVNLNHYSRFQLSSKMVDYVSTRKPIINFIRPDDNLTARIFKDYPAILHLPVQEGCDIKIFVRKIKEFLLNLPKPMPLIRHDRFMAPFKIDTIISSYESLLKDPE